MAKLTVFTPPYESKFSEIVPIEEYSILAVNSTSISDTTVVSIPPGYKARILSIALYATAAANRIYWIRVDGVALYVAFIAAATDVVYYQYLDLPSSPPAYSSISLEIDGGGALTNNDLNIIYRLDKR